MKLGNVSLIISFGVALAGCSLFSGNQFRIATSPPCGPAVGLGPCNVVVSVTVPAGMKCAAKVDIDELTVKGPLSAPVQITWKLDSAASGIGYKFAPVVGIAFADPQFSTSTSAGTYLNVLNGKSTEGRFKYTVNVVGPDGVSYCSPLDPYIYNN